MAENEQEIGGWTRLWIVLSLFFGLFSGAIGYSEASNVRFTQYGSDLNTSSAAFWEAVQRNPQSKDCDWKTITANTPAYGGGMDIYCKTKAPWKEGLKWFAIPGIILWIFGATIGWVWRGFRSAKPSDSGASKKD